MFKLKRTPYIHIIFIFFTFIYSQQSLSSWRLTHATATMSQPGSTTTTTLTQAKTPTTTTTTGSEGIDPNDNSHEDKLFKQQIKELAKELFQFKDSPSQMTQPITKAYVPRAMLEEYIKMREDVRDVIPDDKDFLGKINVDDLDSTHEEFWKDVYNKYGSFDIEVDMGQPEGGLENRRFFTRGDARDITHMGPESDPEDVPPNIEAILPPHSRSKLSQKQFVSVHLKFNLSQEVYTKPTAAEDLKGAELHLARERLLDCEISNCKRKPIPFFGGSQQRASDVDGRQTNHDTNNDNEESEEDNRLHLVPRHQRVYILQIYGYDRYGEPVTKIHATQKLDTHESTPVVFNIYPIVKYWLMKGPKHNHGIIVRVTNDDPAYEQTLADNRAERNRKIRPTRSNLNETLTSNTNASVTHDDLVLPQDRAILEHVRLKRGFRSTSDNADTWLRHQPSILIYTKPSDSGRRHVKRHHSENDDDTNGMQADDPDTVARNYASTSTTTGSSVDYSQRLASESNRSPIMTTSTDKSSGQLSSMSTSAPISRREHTVAANRRGQSSNRNLNSPRAQGQQQQPSNNNNQKSRNKAKIPSRQSTKCSKRTMVINFDEVGWSSWIIAPQSYQANFCAGDCSWPLADTQNATNHAIIQSIYHSVGHSAPKSCCAPVKLGSMAILYQLDGAVQLKHYGEMIVEGCGCL